MTFHRRIVPGYERARVLNPWVFANYGQPQRLRGYVSPVVFQTGASIPGDPYLGTTDEVPFVPSVPGTVHPSATSEPDEALQIMRRMHLLSILSVAIGAAGLYFVVTRGQR